ncbi:MAG TPA: hypothetical protein PLZ68_03505 [Ferruginibacter sp.]|nr:hypothetical protein [Ferruginibacter sp.]
MKNHRKIMVAASVICAGLLFIPAIGFAQLGDIAPDPDAPIDGGVGALLAAGIGYGIKKYRDGKRKAEQ